MPLQNWRIVKQGDTGSPVQVVQFLLRAHGSGIAADGNFGPQTHSAVQQFQTQRGLLADGIVGNQTWPALVVTVGPGATGDAVRAVQVQGLQRFPDDSVLAVDGVYGAQTEDRVRAFQNSWGLTVDGITGLETWSYMRGRDLWPLVKPGATDQTNFLVSPVQFLLRARGFGIAADGVYGPQTENAVRQFQTGKGFPVDGIVDSRTWPVLIIQVGPGDTGDAVRAVQKCFSGLTVDGIYGPKTEERVRDLQEVFLPPADGIVGPKTWYLITVPKFD